MTDNINACINCCAILNNADFANHKCDAEDDCLIEIDEEKINNSESDDSENDDSENDDSESESDDYPKFDDELDDTNNLTLGEIEAREKSGNLANTKLLEEKKILKKEIEKLKDTIKRKDREIYILRESEIHSTQKIKELNEKIDYRDNIIAEFNLEKSLVKIDSEKIAENINNFGQEISTRITPIVLKKSLLAGKSGCSLMFKYLHFHPKESCNYNIKMKGDDIIIYIDNEWQIITEDRLCTLHLKICAKYYSKYLKRKVEISDEEISKYREITSRDNKYEMGVKKLLLRILKSHFK